MDAHDWDERYAQRELVWTAEPNRFLVEQTGHLPAGRALDLAAGEGRNAVWLAQRGWKVTAVDFSAVGVGKGRILAAERGVEIDWVVADVTVWQPPVEAFDLVTVLYLHLPAPQRRAAHALAASAVSPGGLLLIVGHDRANVTREAGGPQDPALLLTAEEVSADLAGTGLIIEHAGPVERPIETEEGPRVAIDLLLRARRLTDPHGGLAVPDAQGAT